MIENTSSRTVYAGGNGQWIFPVAFPFLENNHLRATVIDADGQAAELAAGTDYTVNRMPEGGGELILLGDGIPENSRLAISRRVPPTQETLFHNQGPNSPRAVEEALDKLTMIAQELWAGLDGTPAAADLEALAAGVGDLREAAERMAAAKADKTHGHAAADIRGLSGVLAAKAEAADVAAALADKADIADLPGKSDIGHQHGMEEVTGLAGALARKVDADDPRLGNTAPGSPADSHHSHPAEDISGLAELLVARAEAEHRHAVADVDGLAEALAEKAAAATATRDRDGLMSAADKDKLDALPLSGGGGGGQVGGSIAGELRLWPFRPGSLPAGWHFADGSMHGAETPVGRALMGLPEEYRTDWRIAESGGMVNVPNLLADGGGLFLRPVDGVLRKPGSMEEDAMRRISGDTGTAQFKNNTPVSGPFARDSARTYAVAGTGANTPQLVTMDTARCVPTAHEFRPVNIGMTPAIYLGV